MEGSTVVPKMVHQKYILYEELGRGAFGVTYRAIGVDVLDNYAVKHLEKVSKKYMDSIMREVYIQRQLSVSECSPYVNCLVDAYKGTITRDVDGNYILEPDAQPDIDLTSADIPDVFDFFIISYLIEGVPLENVLMENSTGLPENTCRKYIYQLIQGMKYMHERGIAHHDVKPGNIMVTEEDNIKYIDFGFSCEGIKGYKCSADSGTPTYLPPEVLDLYSDDWRYKLLDLYLSSLELGKAYDIWALGLTIYQIVNGYMVLPYNYQDAAEIFEKNDNVAEYCRALSRNIKSKSLNLENKKGSDGIKKVISRLLEKNWRYRANIHEVELAAKSIESPYDPDENTLQFMINGNPEYIYTKEEDDKYHNVGIDHNIYPEIKIAHLVTGDIATALIDGNYHYLYYVNAEGDEVLVTKSK